MHRLSCVMITVLAAGCAKPSTSAEAPATPPPSPAASVPAPASPVDKTPSVVPAPKGLDAALIFDGRVLWSEYGDVDGDGEDDGQFFCAITYYNSMDNVQEHSVSLGDCVHTSDEDSVFYVEGGKPSRALAIATLQERLSECLKEPRFLPMVRWPTGATTLQVESPRMEARIEADILVVDFGDDETAEFPSFEIPISKGQTPESLHFIVDELVVLRTAGLDEENAKPSTKCREFRLQ